MLEETKKYITTLSERLAEIKEATTNTSENDDLDVILLKLGIKKTIDPNPVFDRREDAEKYQASEEEQKKVVFIRLICKEIVELD